MDGTFVGFLNPDSGLDIFCLQYVALSVIQNALGRFKMYWNNHSIRTEGWKLGLE